VRHLVNVNCSHRFGGSAGIIRETGTITPARTNHFLGGVKEKYALERWCTNTWPMETPECGDLRYNQQTCLGILSGSRFLLAVHFSKQGGQREKTKRSKQEKREERRYVC